MDLLDSSIASYRGRIRSQKWWWPLFNWTVNASAVQAWRLMRASRPSGDPLATMAFLPFLRQLVQETLSRHGKKRLRPGPNLMLRSGAGDSVRGDSGPHIVVYTSQYRRCKGPGCNARTYFECSRCNVGLHPKYCFARYHAA